MNKAANIARETLGLLFDRLCSQDQDPISSAQSLDKHDDTSQEAGPVAIENACSKIDEVTQLRRLPSPGGPGQGPVRVSNASNLAPYLSTPRLFSTTIITPHTTLAVTSSTTTRSPTTSISQRPRSVPCQALARYSFVPHRKMLKRSKTVRTLKGFV